MDLFTTFKTLLKEELQFDTPNKKDSIIKTAVNLYSSSLLKNLDIEYLLNSNNVADNLKALKYLVSLICNNKDVSQYFEQVIKHACSTNTELRVLVYSYVIKNCLLNPDLSVLIISSIQKDLRNDNSLMRAMAIKYLSSLPIPIISPVISASIEQCVNDLNYHVKSAGITALLNLMKIDNGQTDFVIDIIEKSIKDNYPISNGRALMVYHKFQNTNIIGNDHTFIHSNFHKLVKNMVDFDEWSQSYCIEYFTTYSRRYFMDPLKKTENISECNSKVEERDDDDDDIVNNKDTKEEQYDLDMEKPLISNTHHQFLTDQILSLTSSMNPSVTLSIIKYVFSTKISSLYKLSIEALMCIYLHPSNTIKYIVLKNILEILKTYRSYFDSYISYFYVYSCDISEIIMLKLQALSLLINEYNYESIINELKFYLKSTSNILVSATIKIMAKCASKHSSTIHPCIMSLLKFLSSDKDEFVAETVIAIKSMLQLIDENQIKLSADGEYGDINSLFISILEQLSMLVNSIKHPSAKASIIWLIGIYSFKIPHLAPDIFRILIADFGFQDMIVKQQILNLATKLAVNHSKELKLHCEYLLNLAKYDASYDIRDRCRFLKPLIESSINQTSCNPLLKKINEIIGSCRTVMKNKHNFEETNISSIGTFSLTLGTTFCGFKTLPEFSSIVQYEEERNSSYCMYAEPIEECFEIEEADENESEESDEKETEELDENYDENQYIDDEEEYTNEESNKNSDNYKQLITSHSNQSFDKTQYEDVDEDDFLE